MSATIPNATMLRSLRRELIHLRIVKDKSASEAPATRKFGLETEELWERHSQFDKRGAFLKGASCVLGFAEDDAVVMRTLLRQIGLGPCASCVQIDKLQDIASLHNVFSYLFVNIDAFADSDAAVTALLAFRQLRIDVVVMLVSSAVAKDDLGAERAMICDATLRAPVTLARLQRGVSAAFENNTGIRRDRETRGFESTLGAVLTLPRGPNG